MPDPCWETIATPSGDFALYFPASADGGWVTLLHDVGGPSPVDDAPLTAALALRGLRAVAPLAPGSWWTDRDGDSRRPSSAARVVDGAAEVARERWGAAADGLRALAGFGAGGHGALRIAYQRARQFPVVAAFWPAIDCHLLVSGRLLPPPGVTREDVAALASLYRDAEQARQDSAILHLHPLGWPKRQRLVCLRASPWWEGVDRLRMKLAAIGVPFEHDLETTNEPERLVDDALAWVATALRGA